MNGKCWHNNVKQVCDEPLKSVTLDEQIIWIFRSLVNSRDFYMDSVCNNAYNGSPDFLKD